MCLPFLSEHAFFFVGLLLPFSNFYLCECCLYPRTALHSSCAQFRHLSVVEAGNALASSLAGNLHEFRTDHCLDGRVVNPELWCLDLSDGRLLVVCLELVT